MLYYSRRKRCGDMQNREIMVRGVPVCMDDARLTLYRITGSLVEQDSGEWRYHDHFYFECHVISSGRTTFTVGESEYPVEKGEIFIIPPLTDHYPFHEEGEAQDVVLAITVEKTDEGDMYPYFRKSLLEVGCRPFSLPPELLARILLFQTAVEGDSLRDRCLQTTTAYEIVLSLFDRINGFRAAAGQRKQMPSEEKQDITLEYMVNEPDCSLEDIAATLGYTVRHAARLIRARYGKSLSEIRVLNQLSSAKRMLRQESGLSLETIARQTGFRTTDAMCRAFRRWENTTPSAYRKERNV